MNMLFNKEDDLTYAQLLIFQIKRLMWNSNPTMTEPSDLDVIHVALNVLALIGEAHSNPEAEMFEIVELMIEDEEMFNSYVLDFIYNSRERNKSLNELIMQMNDKKDKEVK